MKECKYIDNLTFEDIIDCLSPDFQFGLKTI